MFTRGKTIHITPCREYVLENVLVIIDDGPLRELGAKILEAAGTPCEEAALVSECLVLSNLKGVDSHGVQQIPGYVKA